LQSEAAALHAKARQAATAFLDTRRTDAARIAAVRDVETIFEQDQISGFVGTLRDSAQSDPIRATALRKISPHIASQAGLIPELSVWVQSRRTPKQLRHETLEQLHGLSFSNGMTTEGQSITGAMRALLRDPDIEFRRTAFSVLSAQGDETAQRALLGGLRDPRTAPLPPQEAVSLLGLRLQPDYYPTLFALYRRPPNEETRIASMRLLGGYPEARPELIRAIRNANESLQARLAAAGTLHSSVPEQFGEAILPVVEDEAAPDELRVYGLRAEMLRRESRAFRAARKGPDGFDAAASRLARESHSSTVRAAAGRYVSGRRLP
jgi:hypothetical protein